MSTREQQIARFWSKYLSILDKGQVQADRQRGYVWHAERFLTAIQPRRLAELSAQDVADYLGKMGRETGLAAWQFVQVLDAIRTLGVTAEAPWTDEVDWTRWRASARTLAPDHPTVAPDDGPELAGLEPAGRWTICPR
jgi:hypothetical protein